MKGRWRRDGDVAVPVSYQAKQFLDKIEDGKVFSTERNQRQVALFFVLCDLIADNLGTTKENVKNAALVKAGYVKEWVNIDDKVTKTEPKSIREMSQKEFDGCFKDCIPIMAEWIGVAPEEVQAEVMLRFNEIVDGDLPERMSRKA
jgi:hypothetical protein